MANTVYSYTKTTWTDHVTMGNQTRMNNLETSASVGLYGLNPQLSGPFVHSGITCTKDGTVANQLDIASGYAFATMADGTTGFISVVSDNTHTTSTPSSTYYLFLNNDGTWQWGTTSTGPTNSLPICQATTDGSGNILAVTDVRHTAGSPGVPIVVASTVHLAVTGTGSVQVARSASLSVSGFYRASLYFTYRNATPQKVVAVVNFWDYDLNTAVGANFMAISSGCAGQILNGSQANTPGNNQPVATMPITVFAAAGHVLQISYQDGGGTPNDVVTGVIERIG